MPFLRLTRDRRGFENTFLLHSASPGERPRLLYWYRTAPGILLGRSPLDEDAIRTIEDQHPEIDFDWPAILALGEAMIHEDEAPAARPQKRGRQEQQPRRQREPREPREQQRESRQPEAAVSDEAPVQDEIEAESDAEPEMMEVEPLTPFDAIEEEELPAPPPPTTHGLLEELVGREIATRLRARHAEISARIHEAQAEPAARAAWERRAEALNPDTWLTPDAILEGVRNADKMFEALRAELP